ncbi:MAG: hypothetical protein NZM42_12535 [Gemmatales bacterium]|nr:hypothetical protein [Gemmatales bacterium]MDW8222828.1 hypothetical protein [Gemmatales bacterium]
MEAGAVILTSLVRRSPHYPLRGNGRVGKWFPGQGTAVVAGQ